LLNKYKVFFNGNPDPSKDDFFKSINVQIQRINKNMDDFYKYKRDYEKLNIVNDICNLKCPYCVKNYNNLFSPVSIKTDEKIKLINKCIDQFFLYKLKNNVYSTNISFNGGEILLDWKLIKSIIERISNKYKNIKVKYSLNTNMTLMTEEIAEFLYRYKFKVYISIDGYKEAHNKTRIYHDGRGSFDDVIKNLGIFRKYNKNYQIEGFQGTIEYPDEFDPLEVYKMGKYGFYSARLAPNLLNISEEDAIKKAKLMGRFLHLNSQNKFKVTETYFENMKKLINLEKYFFFFNCIGLSCFPKIELSFNLSTLRINRLCSYIPKATITFRELGYDIYNPKLWEISSRFIQNRAEALYENCINCELVGICRGGCIYTGIDNENQLNKAACVYQKELWKIYVKKVYENKGS